jgi:four helix bundle protein
MFNNNEERPENRNEIEEKTPLFFKFEDLRVYHKSLDYINWLQDINTLFPENEKSQLVARFNDAARNISFYLAEGSASNKSQFIYSLRMAQSSIRECVTFTNIAYRANHISENHEEISRNYLMELTKMTGALINSLQRIMENNSYGNNNSSYNGGNHNSHTRRYMNEYSSTQK